MLPNLGKFEASVGISVKDFFNKIFALLRNKAGDEVVTIKDFLVELVSIGVFERQIPTSHSVKNHTRAPNISLETLVTLACNHFWRSVAWTSTGSLQSLSCLVGITQSEIYYLNVFVII
jgi:hypothetical protein